MLNHLTGGVDHTKGRIVKVLGIQKVEFDLEADGVEWCTSMINDLKSEGEWPEPIAAKISHDEQEDDGQDAPPTRGRSRGRQPVAAD